MKIELLLLFLVFAWDGYFFLRYIIGLTRKYRTIQWNPTVSVIIPAYNEEENIESAIKAALSQDYPVSEVIVVDDGSEDKTYERALRMAQEDTRVKVIRIPHGGKARALNEGIKVARGEIIVTTDADSYMAKDAVRRLVERFYSPDIVGVGGQIRVVVESFLTLVQDIEHLRIAMYRRAKELEDLSLAPGPLSAFRREALDQIGGIAESIVEDYATTKLLKKVGKVVYAPKAKLFTRMPITLKELWRQRKRWFIGDLNHLEPKDYAILMLSDFIAFLDVILPLLFIVRGEFLLLGAFFGFEILTMLPPIIFEGGSIIEALSFPFILIFLAMFYLGIHIYGYLTKLNAKIFK
ncbi:glycosyl transferase [Pyrococcus furiosus DSM 3638]|uniref:Glycosyl transferase n=3 Tax=Pyrococcus furiosus TaxID=2261 RepID=A0A5C0XPR8_PYRFU|nr:glycosyltransferase family 2 protein [Pyrococcus furiosus]AAL80589.1 putative glycosyl transferase [Pyrococcus furiosus DSM 3638]AFN03259.1 glycosyl transferase [Pyrococcus furiosus COM1]QEK78178.1 glycosyl transferase [Pyrococcus furiosus DSM 3638]